MNSIKIGDTVIVNFNNVQYTLCVGVVIYVPSQPGDYWIIKDQNKDELHYISEPCTITKKS